jgi:hypothetical protein
VILRRAAAGSPRGRPCAGRAHPVARTRQGRPHRVRSRDAPAGQALRRVVVGVRRRPA